MRERIAKAPIGWSIVPGVSAPWCMYSTLKGGAESPWVNYRIACVGEKIAGKVSFSFAFDGKRFARNGPDVESLCAYHPAVAHEALLALDAYERIQVGAAYVTPACVRHLLERTALASLL